MLRNPQPFQKGLGQLSSRFLTWDAPKNAAKLMAPITNERRVWSTSRAARTAYWKITPAASWVRARGGASSLTLTSPLHQNPKKVHALSPRGPETMYRC